MRSQAEVEALRTELDELTDKIHDLPLDVFDQFQNELRYLDDVGDALIWVLEEITTDDFRSESMLKLEQLTSLTEAN